MPSRKSSSKPTPEPLPQAVHEWSFEAIGTVWWIGLYEPAETARLAAVQDAVLQRIDRFDAVYSRFRSDSLVSKVAYTSGSFAFPEDGNKLFALYRQLYDATGGTVTPLIGRLLADAGYDATYSLHPRELSTPPEWSDVMSFQNGVLTTTRPVLLDFGAAGKGYLVDLVAAELEGAGFQKFCVDAGGDMLCRGLSDVLHIGLENPDDAAQIVGVATLKDGALCGSASNRRRWAEYHHIMNPATLTSPEEIKAVWVYADDALTADGLATALFFTGAEALRKRFRFECALMYADGTVAVSSDFPAQLFTAQKPGTPNA